GSPGTFISRPAPVIASPAAAGGTTTAATPTIGSAASWERSACRSAADRRHTCSSPGDPAARRGLRGMRFSSRPQLSSHSGRLRLRLASIVLFNVCVLSALHVDREVRSTPTLQPKEIGAGRRRGCCACVECSARPPPAGRNGERKAALPMRRAPAVPPACRASDPVPGRRSGSHRPCAPAAYRAQPARTVQPRITTTRNPKPPPVYRPQATSPAVQMKRAAIAPRVVQCSGNAPAVKDVRLITSIMEPGAKSGFSAITSTGNLNTPGVLQDPDRGTVAFALQVLFTFATGRPRDVDVERAILQSESGFAIGTTWERITKGGWRNDGPPPHEVKYGDDYLVVADAPGVEHLVPIGGHMHKKTFLPQSYPVSYYARFQVNLRYGVPSRIISSIQ